MPRETEKAVKVSLAQDRKVTVDAVKAQIREMCGSRLTLNRPIKLLQGYSVRRLAINNSSKIKIRKKDRHQEQRDTNYSGIENPRKSIASQKALKNAYPIFRIRICLPGLS